MSTRRTTGRAAVGLVCFLLGLQVGAAVLYLVQHRTHLSQPLYLAIFALVCFGTLAVADRLIASRSAPKPRSGSAQDPPSPAG
ncbi:hypothetical protein KV557_00885 [Kitasatospora aureofaciens]|uniref:hypothetical protein n=1 Tax=Kitasatospora aureofaciens TaxID=1894 RepID=UPI001C44E1C0|nr:hypothetical protein [Kitasatospora aureofaciens]MBV6695678.1 hypothetical protein [Kitasatospora aureofaciens]